LAEQLSRHTPVPIPYRAPPNYALIATTAGFIIAFAALARFILPILLSRWTWAVFSIGTSLVMVGGFMFVRIRGMPYVAGSPDGGAQLISPGFQSQYGIEVQIIAFICMIYHFAVYSTYLPLRQMEYCHLVSLS
jgi:oligosaccharyltransferase complex subunit gamma